MEQNSRDTVTFISLNWKFALIKTFVIISSHPQSFLVSPLRRSNYRININRLSKIILSINCKNYVYSKFVDYLYVCTVKLNRQIIHVDCQRLSQLSSFLKVTLFHALYLPCAQCTVIGSWSTQTVLCRPLLCQYGIFS